MRSVQAYGPSINCSGCLAIASSPSLAGRPLSGGPAPQCVLHRPPRSVSPSILRSSVFLSFHAPRSPAPPPPLPTVDIHYHCWGPSPFARSPSSGRGDTRFLSAEKCIAPRNERWDMGRKAVLGRADACRQGCRRAGGRRRRAQVQEGGVRQAAKTRAQCVYRIPTWGRVERGEATPAPQGRHCPRQESTASRRSVVQQIWQCRRNGACGEGEEAA
ncbi:hypothetical protein B0H13DRAFT_603770 [Mycena leptocephala]|nr:hypothetical protein B0H13DRAFT_603770 [Mycena leptocephala]